MNRFFHSSSSKKEKHEAVVLSIWNVAFATVWCKEWVVYINLYSAGMLNDISVGAAAGFGVHTFLPFLSAKNFKN